LFFQISQKLCQFQKQWREGNTESILKEIQTVEPVKLTHKEKEEDSSEEMEEVSNLFNIIFDVLFVCDLTTATCIIM
jgi:hypothetical protein